MRELIILLIVFTFIINSKGQTCCSAGAAMGSNLRVDHNQGKGFRIMTGYEFNDVNTLIDENKRLLNDPRSRVGHKLEMKLDYIFNKQWSLSIVSPFFLQSRTTLSEQQIAAGFGDITTVISHSSFIANELLLAATIGVELPTGAQNLRASDGIVYSPDLQSGSGTFDYIGQISLTKQRFFTNFLTAQLDLSYRRNSTNEHFGDAEKQNGRSFKFGDETVAQTNLVYQMTTQRYFLYPAIGIEFRYTQANEEQSSIAPNSGGFWLNLPISLTLQPSEKQSYYVFANLPLYRDLEGLQITTRFRLGVQFAYHLGSSKKEVHKLDKIILQ